MENMRPSTNMLGPGLQLKPIFVIMGKPKKTPSLSQPAPPPGKHLLKKVAAASRTRVEAAAEMEGHEALQASDSCASNEDRRDDGERLREEAATGASDAEGEEEDGGDVSDNIERNAKLGFFFLVGRGG